MNLKLKINSAKIREDFSKNICYQKKLKIEEA